MFAWRRIGLMLAFPVVLYVVGAAGQKALEAYQLRQEADRLHQEITDLEGRSADLRRQIEYLRSDTYVERAAREELLLVKPGETARVLVTPPQPEPKLALGTTAGRTGVAPGTPDERPAWERWRDFFFQSSKQRSASGNQQGSR